MSGWAGFWLCLAVFLLVECYLFRSGYDTVLYYHGTAAELELQKKAIEERT